MSTSNQYIDIDVNEMIKAWECRTGRHAVNARQANKEDIPAVIDGFAADRLVLVQEWQELDAFSGRIIQLLRIKLES